MLTRKEPNYKLKYSKFITLMAVLLLWVQPVLGQSDSSDEDAQKLREILEPYFIPVEFDEGFLEVEKLKIELGRHLFFDNRLSENSKISCNSCHSLQDYGTNGSNFIEKENEAFFRDTPSIYNVSTLPMFNADGSIEGISKKIKQSFLSPHEMGLESESDVEKKLFEIVGYKELFESVYFEDSNSPSFKNTVDAIQTFIKGLVTPAPIDDFIKGNDRALTKVQIEGGLIFNDKNCYSCHTGSNIGGQMVQKLGITEEWPNQSDLGYYNTFRNPAYKMFFRVSPLRNVEKTAPYFHDASSNELWKVVKTMGRYERGLDISTEEAQKIQTFLKSLTGEIPNDYIEKPTLP